MQHRKYIINFSGKSVLFIKCKGDGILGKNEVQQQVQQHMELKLHMLKNSMSEGQVKASLAILRRGIGKQPGSQPFIWGMLLQDMLKDMMGTGDEPSYAEWAVYVAMTMYALHQQGKDIHTEDMNCEDKQTLGKAIAQLVHKKEDEERIIHRLNTLITSSDFEEVSYHLRGIIQLLRRDNIKLNYPVLAGELYQFQFSEGNQKVGFRWGRDFYQELNKKDKKKGNEKNE